MITSRAQNRWLATAACLLASCAAAPAVAPVLPSSPPAEAEPGGRPVTLPAKDLEALKAELVQKHGAAQQGRVKRGIDQAALLWREADGDFAAFAALAREHFVADPKALAAEFDRFEIAFEQLDGHMTEIVRELRRPTDLDLGPLLPVDPLLAGLEPSAHLTEDLFVSKLGFVVLLNFPLTTLAERVERGPKLSRLEWAQIRLAQRFARRVPAEVQQEMARVGAAADVYISGYNVWMHHVLDEKGGRPFPKGLKLISHWNLRDELKAAYADPKGGDRQRLIVKVMERIVTQTIPAAVIDNPAVDWNPWANEVAPAPAAEVEEGAIRKEAKADPAPEPDTRYAHLLAQFSAAKRADPYSPATPTAIARSFELGREIPEDRVVALMTELLASPVVPKVAKLIEKRLGRPLEPQDLWYDGFQPRSRIPEAQMTALARKRYPNAEAFARDVPRILAKMGFAKDKAEFVASHMVVDAARGAGHAFQAARRGDFPHLRTQIGKDGMDYKGFNTAMHELGHNVEQVFSLYNIDHTLLTGVPNSACTEAMAFVFQGRDVEMLGLAKPDPGAERSRVLNDFWMAWEIAGVSLVDIAAWHWMYDHPDAKPGELKEAIVRIARDTWNRWYAPVLGGRDSPLLAIYSHMISYPLYLCDYTLGHLIAFQLEEHLNRSRAAGKEIERIVSHGAVTPDLWMSHATGAPISAAPLLEAAAKAVGGP